ncbi:MAG: FtsX-like permease family protein [Chloracidobacterium sp.]|nr:FtsX-like permease family protein [Chloracidobacterium sp.]
MSVSGLVLLVACANVANLTLARAATRAKEIGIRLAIVASRGRVVRQLLTEIVLLSLMGGALGLAFAYWGADAIRATVPPAPYPVSLDFAPDGHALRWMLVVSILTGMTFGLAPTLLASRTDLVAVIKGMTAEQSPQTSSVESARRAGRRASHDLNRRADLRRAVYPQPRKCPQNRSRLPNRQFGHDEDKPRLASLR